MLKIVLISIVSLLAASVIGGYLYFKEKFSAPPNELTIPETANTIPFRWVSDSLGDELNPHSAILLPALIPGCSKVFYTQFDLGAPSSVFYYNKIDAINQKYGNIQIHNEDDNYALKHFQFQVGEMDITANKLLLRKYGNSGIDWSDSSIEIIGTLGADLIENKVLIIDYPNQMIVISQVLIDSVKNKTNLTSFKWKERRILLPINLSGNETSLYFDTGSSAFELLTGKSTFEELRKTDSEIKRYGVNSWGKTLWAFTSPTDDSITIAGTFIPLKNVTYIEGTSLIQNLLMRFSGMGGMTGNKLFINKVLIIDTRDQKFGFFQN